VHGARLNGFALLVTLGDRAQASRAAGGALASGAQQAGALRHPERAAAWLRREVMRRIGPVRPLAASDEVERRAALGLIGCRDAAVDGLAALSRVERGAYVAHAVEGFSGIDVEMICQRSAAATRHTLARARDRYLAASMRETAASDPADGPLRRRVRDAASHVMAVADGTAGGTGA